MDYLNYPYESFIEKKYLTPYQFTSMHIKTMQFKLSYIQESRNIEYNTPVETLSFKVRIARVNDFESNDLSFPRWRCRREQKDWRECEEGNGACHNSLQPMRLESLKARRLLPLSSPTRV